MLYPISNYNSCLNTTFALKKSCLWPSSRRWFMIRCSLNQKELSMFSSAFGLQLICIKVKMRQYIRTHYASFFSIYYWNIESLKYFYKVRSGKGLWLYDQGGLFHVRLSLDMKHILHKDAQGNKKRDICLIVIKTHSIK